MKRIVLLITTLLLSTLAASAQIAFQKGSPQVLKHRAAEEGKLIFMDMTASWCGPCNAMNSNVFSTKEVGEFINSNFIPVKIDIDTEQGRILAAEYDVKGVPTMLILDSKMNLLGRTVGYRSKEQFLSDMKRLLSEIKKRQEAEQR